MRENENQINPGNRLLNELYRLNRSGLINDEEFLVLRKIIKGKSVPPEVYERFDKLFTETSDIKSVEKTCSNNKDDLDETIETEGTNFRNKFSLAAMAEGLNRQLVTLGGFDHERELLSCPCCGLMENVTSKGQPITTKPENSDIDTGLRFIEQGGGKWQCPVCEYVLSEV